MTNRLSKKILSVFLAAALLTALLPAAAVTAFAAVPDGSWADFTEEVSPDDGVYTVTTAEELAWVAAQVNGQIENFGDCTVELGNDIGLSAHYWVPIGGGGAPFEGDFDGNGHTLSGLTIDGEIKYAGLFGYARYGTIEDVNLENVSIEASYGAKEGCAGGIAGYPRGVAFKNCSVAGGVSLSSASEFVFCGGLAGWAIEGTTIEGCSVSGSVMANMDEKNTFCGGLVGEIDSGSVSDCVSSADVGGSADYLGGFAGKLLFTSVAFSISSGDVVNSLGGAYTGGFSGYVYDSDDPTHPIEDCLASGDVMQIVGAGKVGGFVGQCSFCPIISCSAAGDVSGGDSTGGFIGFNESPITDCRAEGSLSNSSSSSACGGFVGYNSDTITNCYATGKVDAQDASEAGGFVGMSTHTGNISSCYAAGEVISSHYAGGFAGYTSGQLTDCYAAGGVTGGEYAGGFAGFIYTASIGETSFPGTLTSCYSVGAVSGASYAGGFVGKNEGNHEAVCIWLSGSAESAAGDGDSSAAVKTDVEMKDSEFVDALNSGRTPARWTTVAGHNSGYPVLIGVGDGAGTKYTVTFMDGENTDITYRIRQVAEGTTIAKPNDPEKDGYTFDGWFDAPSYDEEAVEWDFTTDTVTEDLALYAHWTLKTYGVSGRVSSAFDAISVAGLTVGLYDADAEEYSGEPLYSAATDENGEYSIAGVENGYYVAVIAASGDYVESKSASFEAGDDEDVTADIALNILCTVGGQVTLPDRETPAPGVTVKLYQFIGFSKEIVFLDTTTADDDGNYSFSMEISDDDPRYYAVTASSYTTGGKTYCGNSRTAQIELDEGTVCEVDVSLIDLGDSWLTYAEEPDDYAPGDDEIFIYTPEELAWVAEQSVLYFEDFGGIDIVLAEDLDLGAHDWWPIGSGPTPFMGGFSGDGYVISNLKVNVFSDDNDDSIYSLGSAGLFSCIEDGWVMDLGLENVSVTFDSNDETESREYCIGALAGYAGDYSYFEGCYSTGSVSSSSSGSAVGGLIGTAFNLEIYECYSECDVSGTYAHGSPACEGYGGGLLGHVLDYSEVYDCYATGDVTGTCGYNGGLVGCYLSGEWVDIVNCYAVGDVSGAAYNGSFAGYGDYGDDSYTESIYWLAREDQLGIADGNADSLALNDPDSGCGMSHEDMTKRAFAEQLNSLHEEWEDEGPWMWYEDVNGGYPVLRGVGVGNETSAPTVTTQPESLTVTVGDTASFTAEADGYPDTTVQWQVSTNGGLTFTNITGADEETYSFTAALADSGKQYRAVFTNSVDTAFSNAATLTVNLDLCLPTVTTDAVGVTRNSAAVSGSVTDAGGKEITERGFVYGISANPTTSGNKVTVSLGTGTGDFRATLTGLSFDTTYHVRAYAINSEGTSYGEDLEFTTLKKTSGSSSGKNDKNFIPRSLSDKGEGVSVSGSIREDADLTVEDVVLHKSGTCEACDEIRAYMADQGLLTLFCKDISLSKNFHGSVTVTIRVGSRHNGEKVTILHCDNKTLEAFKVTVKDGKVTFTVTGLSPFAVFVKSQAEEENPDTGIPGGGLPLWIGLLPLAPLCGALYGSRKKKRA